MSFFDGTHLLGAAKAVSTTLGDQAFITIPNASKGVIIDKVTFCNASVSFATSTSTPGVYTGAGATGTAVCTGATANITPLTTSGKYVDGTVATAATNTVVVLTQQTSGTYNGLTGVFVNLGGTNNVAGTFDVLISGRQLV